ncbi:MAG TPA: spermidine/putrescine ABC transporter substrate-binding protein [Candidatus Polarisedimenticolia bacterium]|nr:spermidine/putrescine ABC transporter substrate-binding protein [Candidatus Polarisedimenticolia bacterium]
MTEHDRSPIATPLDRRTFLQGSALAGFAAFLAACGTDGTGGSPSAAASTEASAGASASPGELGGTVNFANWIGYIDVDDDNTTHPTLDKFTDETGVTVNYVEAVDDNETFFTRDLQGPLSQGLATQWDIFVVTDWMVARLARLGWLEKIDTANTPNFPTNLLDQYHGRSFDPDTNLAAPWQSGMTGIGFDKAQTGDLDSLEVFWDETYKGKLTYLTEMRDTVGLAAIKLGFKPEELTEDQFQQALTEVDNAVKAGLVRQLTGNSYVDVMASGDAIVAIAWSGDVSGLLVPDQTPEQDFQWALPKEGGMLWTDNMVMPKGVVNKAQAEAWINFYYEPVNAAAVEAWVNYVCPVKGAREVLVAEDPEIGDNPLIFPPDDYVARLHQFRSVTAEEEQAWSEDFSRVLGL